MTEGAIAVDDDLTTPVFSHYSGRVIKVAAMLGDVVKPGDPLFVIHASEFVQAQNDLITALANLQTARSQLTMAQTNEKTHSRALSGARRLAQGLATGPDRPDHRAKHRSRRRDRPARSA
jgi:membrane fusion protein, heavy metal efflux system